MSLSAAHRVVLATCATNAVADRDLAADDLAVVALHHDGRVEGVQIFGDRHAARIAQRRAATRIGAGAVVRAGRASVLAYGI